MSQPLNFKIEFQSRAGKPIYLITCTSIYVGAKFQSLRSLKINFKSIHRLIACSNKPIGVKYRILLLISYVD